MNSKELYDLAVERIKESCNKEDTDLNYFVDELSFTKTDLSAEGKSSTRSPNELYSLLGDDGGKVEVNYYAYDPTKTFSPIEPDINKFFVRLFDGAGKEQQSYTNSFSDKPY